MKKTIIFSILLLSVFLASCGEKEAETQAPVVPEQVVEAMDTTETDGLTSTGEVTEPTTNIGEETGEESIQVEDPLAPVEETTSVEPIADVPTTIEVTTDVNPSAQEIPSTPETDENTDEIVQELIDDIDSIFGDIESAE